MKVVYDMKGMIKVVTLFFKVIVRNITMDSILVKSGLRPIVG